MSSCSGRDIRTSELCHYDDVYLTWVHVDFRVRASFACLPFMSDVKLAFFEGLTGPDTDIDAASPARSPDIDTPVSPPAQISELEEFEESALDMEEADDVPPIDIVRQRRLSQMLRRRASQSSSQRQLPPGIRRRPCCRRHSDTNRPGRLRPKVRVKAKAKLNHSNRRHHSNSNCPRRSRSPARASTRCPRVHAWPRTRSRRPLRRSALSAHRRRRLPPRRRRDSVLSYGPVMRRRLSSMHVVANLSRRGRTYLLAGGTALGEHGRARACGCRVAGGAPVEPCDTASDVEAEAGGGERVTGRAPSDRSGCGDGREASRHSKNGWRACSSRSATASASERA